MTDRRTRSDNNSSAGYTSRAKNDIQLIEQTNKHYPEADDISSLENNLEFIPDSLQILLRTLFAGKEIEVKVAAIGQSIMQSSSPRGIMSPLMLALGVQMHHHFASKFLIETLYSLGFSCSYTEVKKYEKCAAAFKGTDIPGIEPNSFLQFVADNVDHNSRTIDGHNRWYGNYCDNNTRYQNEYARS